MQKNHKLSCLYIKHLVDGFADPIEIDGQKFQADPDNEGQPLKDADGNPVKFEEAPADPPVDPPADPPTDPVDPSKMSLEDLAKTNPDVAKVLQERQEAEAEAQRVKTEAEKKAEEDAKKNGNFQELYESTQQKLDKANAELNKKDDLLGKYKGSTQRILDDTLATIPEEKRGLIPADFSPRQKLEYITANAKLLGAKVGLNKGSQVDPNEDTPDDTTEEAKLVKEFQELVEKGKNRTAVDDEKMFEVSKKLKEIRQPKS